VAWFCYLNAAHSLYRYYAPGGDGLEFFLFFLNIVMWLFNLLVWEKNQCWMHNQRVILREYRRNVVERVNLLRQKGVEPKKMRYRFMRLHRVTLPPKK